MAWLNPVSIGDDPWLFSRTGQVPLVVTFAHAGRRRVSGITVAGGGTLREDGGASGCRYNDSLTDENTDLVAEALFEAMDWAGVRPYAVLPVVSRRDCDLNRSWDHNRLGYEAGGVDPVASELSQGIYDTFYAELARFIGMILTRFTDMPMAPVLIDIHRTGLVNGVDLEIGTRRGASASASPVYGATDWSLSLHQSLSDEGFAVFPDPGGSENWSGCRILRTNGTGGLGADAVQLELDNSALSETEAPPIGRRIARALEAFLRMNNYPIIDESEAMSIDDELYATLFL